MNFVIGQRVRFTPQDFTGTVRGFIEGNVLVTWDDGLNNDAPIAPLHLEHLCSYVFCVGNEHKYCNATREEHASRWWGHNFFNGYAAEATQ